MPTIVCYGDSNTWGAVPQAQRGAGGRFGPSVRWTGILNAMLGAEYTIAEEGLNGRTTCRDDPVEGAHKNGARFLQVVLETHQPIDLLIVMLGTNDLKTRLSMQAGDIAAGMGVLAGIANRSACGADGHSPKVLLISPAPLARLGWLAEMFEGGTEKSRKLGAEVAMVAEECGALFLDAGTLIRSSDIDGIHLDHDAHRKLGEHLARLIPTIL
jgi:lysophospholipase L1-like esterase